MLSFLSFCEDKREKQDQDNAPLYLQNKAPLAPNAYLELPLGAIQPKSWLKEQLEIMASGMTGKLDSIYPKVVGERNGWLGGDGDGWERGPYWIDGLLPLAYILDREDLKEKVQPWIEWTLTNQTEEGYIGPIPFVEKPAYEPGLQRDNRRDWWPKMVMLKVLQQYYNATQDTRVIEVLTKYFKYQLAQLPKTPLDALTFWGNRRGADNLMVVYWLHAITGDDFLLELGDIIKKQTFPWQEIMTHRDLQKGADKDVHFGQIKGYPFDDSQISAMSLSQIGKIHTVNLAQGFKAPIVGSLTGNVEESVRITKDGFADVDKYHGQPQGMYGGDEPLHGNNPLQGVEFCSISEMMFSLETILKISGDITFADRLERIVYNALPTQAADDFMSRQYFQAANQVALTDKITTSYETHAHKGTDFVYGALTGYPCCTTNMHQSWPKYVQNLFYATPDRGVAALLYGPSEVHLKVANNKEVKITEVTGFPFRESVQFTISLKEEATFPFHVRIPSWCTNPSIKVNGEALSITPSKGIAIINRAWKNKDVLTLELPMQVKASHWYGNTSTLERGPLVYALKINAEWKSKNRNDGYGAFEEVFATEDWNYGLLKEDVENLPKTVKVIEKKWDGAYPWTLDNVPIQLEFPGVQLKDWTLVNGVPELPEQIDISTPHPKEVLTLVPYGSTTLRISEFPTISINSNKQ